MENVCISFGINNGPSEYLHLKLQTARFGIHRIWTFSTKFATETYSREKARSKNNIQTQSGKLGGALLNLVGGEGTLTYLTTVTPPWLIVNYEILHWVIFGGRLFRWRSLMKKNYMKAYSETIYYFGRYESLSLNIPYAMEHPKSSQRKESFQCLTDLAVKM